MSRANDIILSAFTGALAGHLLARAAITTAGDDDPEEEANRQLEQWKEINEHARHWEKLVFESAKHYFTVVAAALAGAGVALGWTKVPGPTQQAAIVCFLAASLVLSGLALISLVSQKRYLRGFYNRRKEIENQNRNLRLRNRVKGSGWTFAALIGGFGVALLLSGAILVIALTKQPRPLLDGARLEGADLTMVVGLRQDDLQGACGDSSTKLPTGLTVKPCCRPASVQPGAAGDAPKAARP